MAIENDKSCQVQNKEFMNRRRAPDPPGTGEGDQEERYGDHVTVESHEKGKIENGWEGQVRKGKDRSVKGAEKYRDGNPHQDNIKGNEKLLDDKRGKKRGEGISDDMKSEIGDWTQMKSEKRPPFFTSVKQVVKDDEIIEMAGAVLGGKVGEPPDQADMEGKENKINY